MKYVSTILLVLSLAFLLASCNLNQTDSPTDIGEPITSESTTTQHASTITFTIPDPDSIKIGGGYEYAYEKHYREAYYYIGGSFSDLVDVYAFEQWADAYWNSHSDYVEPEEMFLVAFIKHFNIPREQFEIALEKFVHNRIAHGLDLTDETNEPPNPDIIYTFDNEIINEYYRRR